jgi:hypothetical protein
MNENEDILSYICTSLIVLKDGIVLNSPSLLTVLCYVPKKTHEKSEASQVIVQSVSDGLSDFDRGLIIRRADNSHEAISVWTG